MLYNLQAWNETIHCVHKLWTTICNITPLYPLCQSLNRHCPEISRCVDWTQCMFACVVFKASCFERISITDITLRQIYCNTCLTRTLAIYSWRELTVYNCIGYKVITGNIIMTIINWIQLHRLYKVITVNISMTIINCIQLHRL